MLAWGRTRVKARRFTSAARVLRWSAVAAWMGGIFYLSHQSSPLGAAPSPAESLGAHLGLYAGLAMLLWWALGGMANGRGLPSAWVRAGFSFALAVLYGVSDEIHQAFVPGRTAAEADIALDAAGAALGATLAWLLPAVLFGERRR